MVVTGGKGMKHDAAVLFGVTRKVARGVCCLAACCASLLWLPGCFPRYDTANTGAEVIRAVPPPRHAAMTPYTTLKSQRGIAAELNHRLGFRKTVVLQEGSKVYVGALPADSGATGPRSGGVLSQAIQREIRHVVGHALLGVRAVFITVNPAAVDMLQHYADYVQRGGDVQPYLQRFHLGVERIWPNGRGVAPDRPSASPAPGTLETPVDKGLPVGRAHPQVGV